MRKLTAGIFSVLLGLVSAGIANAAVVSTDYLSQVLEAELADVQTTLTATGPVKIVDNVISVDTGAVSEQGTNLVTSAGIYAAVNDAVADLKVDEVIVSDGKYFGAYKQENGKISMTEKSFDTTISDSVASNNAPTTEAVKDYVGGVFGAIGDVVDAQLSETIQQAADADQLSQMNKQSIEAINHQETGILKTAQNYTDAQVKGLAEGAVATNTANLATEKSAREAADTQLQANIDLKANIADVYSKDDADKKFEAQEAATAKLQAAKDYTDAQLKTLTEDMWGGGEGSEDQGLQGTVASQALKITALEDKVGDKSVVARIGELDSPDSAVDKEFVTAVSENDGVITVSRRALAAADIPVIAVSQVDGLQAALDAKQVNLTGQDGVIVIADGVISIASGGIETAMIDDKAVTSEKLADNSVTAGKIADGAVTEGTIADGAVVAGNLAQNSVVKGNIAAGAVETGNIADKAVGAGQLADNAVGTDQLADSVNSLLAGAIQAPSETSADGTFVLTAKKVTGTDGAVTYSYAWEDIAGR